MGDDDDDAVKLPHYCVIQVHRLMCLELKKFIDRILPIFPAVELVRPRSSGFQALCSLQVAVDDAKLLIQHCSESSKLYLAITGKQILLRCEKIQSNLMMFLSQVQDTVPSLLAAKIYVIVDDLRTAKFPLESSESEAGVIIQALLCDISASHSVNNFDINVVKLASLRLNITSPLALLIEKRSIKRQLQVVPQRDLAKKKILKCLQYLLRKYGDSVRGCQDRGGHAQDQTSFLESPEDFKCPISRRLLYEPVVIANGKTFERVWIEKWFSDGHGTCPITRIELNHLSLTPNTLIQTAILQWRARHGIAIPDPCAQPNVPRSSSTSFSSSSVVSFGSSMNDLNLPVSGLSLCSSDTSWGSESLDGKIGDGTSLAILSKLAALPWRYQCEVVEDIRGQLNDNLELQCTVTFSDRSIKAMVRFLKDARDSGDAKAQRDGAEVLAVIFAENRSHEMPVLDDEAVYLLASFLDSENADKALVIMESLSSQEDYKTRIVASGAVPLLIEVLETPIKKFQMIALKTLSNLSSNTDIGYHMVYLGCISKLVSFLGDPVLAGYCIKIVKNLCNSEEEEAKIAVAETNICINSIAKLVQDGSQEVQEDAVEVILSLCNLRDAYCENVICGNSIMESIADLSANGKSRVKVISTQLLQLLAHVMQLQGGHVLQNVHEAEERKLGSKAFGLLGKGRKMSAFSKPGR